MNRRRNETETKISPILYIAPIIGSLIAATGGVLHVHYKNRHIQTSREIDAVERRIEQHHLDIRIAQMRSDQILNLFAMRQQLEETGTTLRRIPATACEDILPHNPPSVAATTP